MGTWVRHPVSRRGWALVALLLFGVLGQGERFSVDARFRTPDATLATYWEALRANDVAGAWECLARGPHEKPYPGMVWFLPPTEDLRIAALEALPVEHGRMVVAYEVRYRPLGADEVLSFRIESELVRVRGEWRLANPVDAGALPEWRPTRRPAAC